MECAEANILGGPEVRPVTGKGKEVLRKAFFVELNPFVSPSLRRV
jgi:hypothetical protein